jgi:transcriptional regulator with XRE-family HTH domain
MGVCGILGLKGLKKNMYKIPDEVVRELIVDKSMTDDQAAKYLGVSRMTVSRRRVKLGIGKKPKRPDGYYELTEEQNHQIKNFFFEGKNDYEVAKIMHLGRNRLREWRKKRGIPSQSNKKGLGGEDAEKAILMRNSGSTYDQIADEFGVKRTSISKLLKKSGYKEKNTYRPISPEWTQSYTLTDDQRSIIIGDLLGDGTLVSTSEENAYYQSGHSNYQEFFIRWKYSVLSPLTSSVGSKKDYSAYTVKTWTCHELGALKKLFYPKGNKVINKEIADIINELILAVWYMGDGSLSRKTPYIHIGKQVDASVFKDSISNNLSISSYVRTYSKEYHLVFDSDSFFKKVTPYILPEFYKKVPETYRINLGKYWFDKSLFPYVTSDIYLKLPDKDKPQVVNALCDYYRKKGFPYPRYNRKDLLKFYKSFIDKDNEVAAFKICNHFMPHRYDCRRYDSNPMENWNNDQLFRKLIINRLTYGKGYISDSVIRTGMQLKGVVANFSPSTARYIYNKYLPEGGSALDFSSGFGGRLLGFMASKPSGTYLGVEPFSKSHVGLEKMKEYFLDHNKSKSINIIRSPFEDLCSKFNSSSFDMVFSSPPYYGLEIYSEESTQSFIRYPKYEDWLNNFWYLVLDESIRVLKRSGHLIFSIGNYKSYDLVHDTKSYLSQKSVEEKYPMKIHYKNVYLKTNKKENVFIYKKL